MSKINLYFPHIEAAFCQADGRMQVKLRARRRADIKAKNVNITLHLEPWQLQRFVRTCATALDKYVQGVQARQKRFQNAAMSVYKKEDQS